MIWVLLAALGVPLWLLIGALGASLWSRRTFKRAAGTFPAKARARAGAQAGVNTPWPRRPEEITRLGPSPVVLTLHLDDGTTMELAGREEDRGLVGTPLSSGVPGTSVPLRAASSSTPGRRRDIS
jgi:hypothetical protein